MDTSDLKETSMGEDAGRNKSHISLESLAGSKMYQLIESDKKSNSDPTKQTNRPGAKSVSGTRFTIERVHECEMECSPVLLSVSEQSKCSPLSKPSAELTMTEPCGKNDMQYASSSVSNEIRTSDDLHKFVISSPCPVAELKQGTADVLSDRVVRHVVEVGVGQEDGELKENTDQVVNDKSSTKEGQDQEVETVVKPKEKIDEAFQREYEKRLEAGQEEYQSGQQRYQDCLGKEIQKLEEENEKALQRHREILVQRLKDSIIRLETEQVCIYSFM
jgi:hypothetical protein